MGDGIGELAEIDHLISAELIIRECYTTSSKLRTPIPGNCISTKRKPLPKKDRTRTPQKHKSPETFDSGLLTFPAVIPFGFCSNRFWDILKRLPIFE
jgi:hypothetical protein